MNRPTRTIPIARPSIGEQEIKAVTKVMKTGWITTGKETLEFEKEFSNFINAKHCLAVNSCTAALHLLFESLGIRPGEKVLTSPYTFISTATSILHAQAVPVFADIESDNFHISPEAIEAACKKEKISAVVPVHIAGTLCDMEAIMALSHKYDFKVIEDCAHSFPVNSGLGYAGTIGHGGAFSFYATKTITTAEGGMAVCADEEAAEKLKVLRIHGINRDVWFRYTDTKPGWYYDVTELGYKYNLSDMASAMGRIQLARAEEMKASRKKIADYYLKELKNEDFLELPPCKSHEDHSWHLFVISLNLSLLTINRDQFIEKLSEAGIGSSVHFIPVYAMTYFKNSFNLHNRDFPHTENRFQRVISIPIYDGLSESDLAYICENIRAIGRKYRKKKVI